MVAMSISPAAVRIGCPGTRRTRMIRALSGPISVSCRLRGFPAGKGRPVPAAHTSHATGNQAVTACFWSLLVTWMLRGLAAS